MDENTIIEISQKFKKLLIDNNIFSESEIIETGNKALEKYNLNLLEPIIFLINFNFKNYNKLAEILIDCGIPEKAITGKKIQKSNQKLIVHGIEKIYSIKCITAISRRLTLPNELLNKPIKDVFSPNPVNSMQLINTLVELPYSDEVISEVEKNKYLRKKLFSNIRKILGETGAKINLYFRDYRNNPFELSIDSSDNASVVLNEKQIQDFYEIDFPLIITRMSTQYHIDSLKTYYNGIKTTIEEAKMSGVTCKISLQRVANGFLGPYCSQESTTHRYNPNAIFKFKTEEIKNLSLEFKDKLTNFSDEFIYINDLAFEFNKTEDDELIDNSISQELELSDLDQENIIDDKVNTFARNKIFFGPPGTGKSYIMEKKAEDDLEIDRESENFIRITFHPEYSYYDFVGQYKPVVGFEKVQNKITNSLGEDIIEGKPIIYYDFVPGPFTKAILKAINQLNKNKNILLIIEEINRGNCAAIFGDIFQLLDRVSDIAKKEKYGYSEYSIDVSEEMKSYFKRNVDGDIYKTYFSKGFRLPKNLFIYATMNTSDQSLFPMDSAFKRRWSMEYIPINYNDPRLNEVILPEPYNDLKWLNFIEICNQEIVTFTQSDDKQIGQWFLKSDNEISKSDFVGKILSYLWFDVFRHDPSRFFKPEITTYDDIINNYSEGVIKEDIITKMLG